MLSEKEKIEEARHRECKKKYGDHSIKLIPGEYSMADNGRYARTWDGFMLAKYRCIRCGQIQYFKVMI